MERPSILQLLKRPDIALAILMVGVIVVMIIPVPKFFVDILLATSITLALFVLLVSLYTERPLDFSVFPTLLLVVTLYRLALNVATTRLILLRGHEGSDAAGKIIQAFGQFVVGGNYAVGFVIFLVLVIINFIVITKGAGRIAEVAARFTLDAMPGKQMSIDADLNSGLIDEEQARRRRREIEREADFYGAMDGASKFVRGDAIAGIIITLVNILGGFFIGVIQRGLSIGQAAQNYTLLTIGDGLVSQIPALIVSTSAGIVVSRASGEAELAIDFGRQLFGREKVMFIAAGFLLFFAIVPGLPTVPFLILASMVAFAGVRVRKMKQQAEQRQEKPPEPEEFSVDSLLQMDLVELELGYGLVSLLDTSKGGTLLEKIANLRSQLAHKMGFVIPPIHIRDNLDLKAGQYRVLVKGNEVSKVELWPDRLLAIDPGTVKSPIDGIAANDPTFGLPAVWIKKTQREQAMFAGYTVVDCATVITTHLAELFKQYSPELMTRQDVQQLLDGLSTRYPKLVSEVTQSATLGVIQKVLKNLLSEGIPIKDLVTILETLGDWAPNIKEPNMLTEYVRQSLARTITSILTSSDGVVWLSILDSAWERILLDHFKQSAQGGYLDLNPELAQKLINKLEDLKKEFEALGKKPVVLVPPIVRGHVRKLVERFVPDVLIVSSAELEPQTKIKAVKVLEFEP